MAPGYRTKSVKVYKYQKYAGYTMEKKVDTKVNISVIPSNADIYYSNGNKAGTGSCILTFDEEEKSDAFFELKLESSNYYSQTVKVYKSEGSRQFSLQRKPSKTVVVIPADADISVNNE